MKKLPLLFLLIVLKVNAYAQTPNWLWAIGSTGSSYEYTAGIAVNPGGDLFVGGRCAGTMNFGGMSVSAGGFGDNPFMGRFSNSGTAIWLKEFTYSSSYDYTNGFWKDNQDNTYSSGQINSNQGIFINKYNSAGVLKMNVQTSSPAIGCYGVGVDNNTENAIYVVGAFGSGTTNFGSFPLTYSGNGNANSGGQGAYLAKVDSNGNYLWSRMIAGTGAGIGYDQATSVTVDPLGDVYVCGGYGGTPVFDGGTATVPTATYNNPPSPTSPIANLFVAKYDASGNLIWVSYATNAGVVDGGYWDHGAIVADSCGNVYVTGNFESTAQFGTQSVTSAGGNDIFVAKCLNNGQWEWVKRAGGTGDEYCNAIALDKYNNVYIGSAYAAGSINFSGGASISGGDLFVAKFANSTGDFQWAQSATAAGGVGGLTIDKQGYTYVTGSFSGASTFGSSTFSGGSGNNFIAKLDSGPPLKIQAYPAPLYCPGQATQLTYTVVGAFNAGNVFTAQLSDANQSFISPTDIGTVTSTAGGTITITIPAGTPVGNYLIRVISSNPSWGSFNNNCYSIANFPTFLPGTTSIGNNFTVTISNNTTVCPNTQVPLTVTGGTTYLWSPLATLSCDTCHNPTATPTTTTTYYVTVSNNQCPPLKDSVVVTVIPFPVLVAGPDTSFCTGQSAVLNVTGGTTYAWSPAAGLSCVSCANPVASPSISTTYTVTGTNQMCRKIDSVVVAVIPPPTLVLQDITICSNVATQLNATTNGSLQWSPGDGLSCDDCNDPVAQLFGPETYTVTASTGVCTTTGTIKVSIDTPFVYAGSDTTIFKGTNAQLLAEGATTYSWLPTDGLSNSSIFDPTASPSATTNYTVIGYDAFGCATTDQVLVTVNDPCLIPLPNAFSPNNDGINDLFNIVNPFIDKVLDFEIYNRWGEMVFQTNFVDRGWDGNFNGHPEPVGTYVYFVKTICQGQEITYKGNVTLIR